MNALSSSEQFGFVCFLAKTKEAEGKREREKEGKIDGMCVRAIQSKYNNNKNERQRQSK